MREDYPYMEKSVGPDYVSFHVGKGGGRLDILIGEEKPS